MSGVIIWSKFAFSKRTQLGPENNPYLDQIITPQNVFFLNLFAFIKNVLKYQFLLCFFWTSTKIGITPPPPKKKNDNLSHFAKHRLV